MTDRPDQQLLDVRMTALTLAVGATAPLDGLHNHTEQSGDTPVTTPATQPEPVPAPPHRLTDRERAIVDRVLASAVEDKNSVPVAAFNSSI